MRKVIISESEQLYCSSHKEKKTTLNGLLVPSEQMPQLQQTK